jgi:hypothetical protein
VRWGRLTHNNSLVVAGPTTRCWGRDVEQTPRIGRYHTRLNVMLTKSANASFSMPNGPGFSPYKAADAGNALQHLVVAGLILQRAIVAVASESTVDNVGFLGFAGPHSRYQGALVRMAESCEQRRQPAEPASTTRRGLRASSLQSPQTGRNTRTLFRSERLAGLLRIKSIPSWRFTIFRLIQIAALNLAFHALIFSRRCFARVAYL